MCGRGLIKQHKLKGRGLIRQNMLQGHDLYDIMSDEVGRENREVCLSYGFNSEPQRLCSRPSLSLVGLFLEVHCGICEASRVLFIMRHLRRVIHHLCDLSEGLCTSCSLWTERPPVQTQ